MVAPIQNDHGRRLYGTDLVDSFDRSYQWIRSIFHLRHSDSNLVTAVAARSMKMVAGVLAMTKTAVIALFGRIVQIAHCQSTSIDVQQPMPAKEKFFRGNIYLPLVLQFSTRKDLATMARTSKSFSADLIMAGKLGLRSRKILSLNELTHFAKRISIGQNSVDFAQISPYLDQLTGLDLSNWDFVDDSFRLLHTLTADKLQQITSLNFTKARYLTEERLQLLLNLFSPGKLNYFDFTGSSYEPLISSSLHNCTALIDGQATWISQNGNKYEGSWLEGKYSGQGTFSSLHSHSKYVGVWLEGKPAGQGTLTNVHGKYEGGFIEGRFSGQGIRTYANGVKYEGAWLVGERIGPGTYTYANGIKYKVDHSLHYPVVIEALTLIYAPKLAFLKLVAFAVSTYHRMSGSRMVRSALLALFSEDPQRRN